MRVGIFVKTLNPSVGVMRRFGWEKDICHACFVKWEDGGYSKLCWRMEAV